MSRTFRQTHHDTQSQIFFLHFKTLPKIIQKISFCSSDYMLRPSPPPPYPYMRIACMHITESVSFTSCLINSTVLCHSTLLCANFTPLYATLRHFAPLCATLRLFTPLCATLLYLGRPGTNELNTQTSCVIYKAYMIPRLVYGLEIVSLNKSQLSELERTTPSEYSLKRPRPKRITAEMTRGRIGSGPK